MAEARVKRGLFPFSRLMSLAAAASLTMKTRKRSDGSTVRPAEVQASLSREVVKVEPLATVMTVLRQFIDEIASELDARTDKPLAPHHWIGFVKLLGTIDQDDDMGELRQRMEQIVSQRDVRFQDRCLALIPLLSADPAIAAEFTARRHAAIRALAAL